MPGKIHLLPEELTSRIAAGEVVERPASIVKELLENALDAGATDLLVVLEGGGAVSIRIADNGTGIDPEEAPLAFQRYATSKITHFEDLWSVRSFGFRGEALPSIASIARVEMTTRTRSQPGGTRIVVQDGEILEVSEAGGAPGTTIFVSRIFEAVPVRKKFLRSEKTEQGACLDVVLRIALAHPRVRIRVTASGKDLLNLPATEDPAERSALVLGPDFTGEAVALSGSAGGSSLAGFISRPERTRSSTRQMLFFVNGRYVRDALLHRAVMTACRRRIEARRYPSALLFLDMAPAEVDVNVHPAKMEVRFRKPGEVFQLVHDCIERALSRFSPVFPAGESPDGGAFRTPAASGRVEEALRRYVIRSEGEPSHREGGRIPAPMLPLAPEAPYRPAGGTPTVSESRPGGASDPSCGYIGQLAGTYLLFEAADGLLIVDQHAAHERLLYERLHRQEQDRPPESQRLLIPEVVALPRKELRFLVENAAVLEDAGVLLEPFGGDSVVVKALPVFLAAGDIRSFLLDLAEEVGGDDPSGRGISPLRDRMLVFLACRGAVKARREMSREEAIALLTALGDEPQAATCPHGRPVVVRFGTADLEKLFRRR
ncbi:MAG: DNA mismatch repair endonuclease MutL [Syntrophaceae bacterium]|nr:DNA mismatch repair endonuclease MutL [Syntrophaceae bacterium]